MYYIDAQPAGSTSRKRPAASAQSNSSSGESSKHPKTATGNDDLDMDKIIKDHFLGMCYACMIIHHTA